MQNKDFYSIGDTTQILPRIDWNIRFFGAHRQTVPSNWSMTKEFHHGFEILIVLEGAQETVIENERYLIEKGDILLIPPGFEHTNRCISARSMTYFCAHFNIDEPSMRMKIMKDCDWIYPSSSAHYAELRSCLDRWLDLFQFPDAPISRVKLQAQIILFELLEIMMEIRPSQTDLYAHHSMTTIKYAKEIAEAIKVNFKKSGLERSENPDAALHIQPIIAALGISPNYGLEIFQKVYHMSPRAYLSDLKLQEAKVMLQQPEMSLNEIADRLGYKNLSHFSRQFKRWTGLSPTEFRKKTNA